MNPKYALLVFLILTFTRVSAQNAEYDKKVDSVNSKSNSVIRLSQNRVSQAKQSLSGQSGINVLTGFKLVADGKTDNTELLQHAVDSASKMLKPLFFPAGVYICGRIQLRSGLTIIGEGDKSIIRSIGNIANSTNLFTVIGRDSLKNVSFYNICLDGNKNSNGQNIIGRTIQIYGSQHLQILNVTFLNAISTALYFTNNTDVVIDGCNFLESGQNAVVFNNCTDVVFSNNHVTGWSTQNVAKFPCFSTIVPSHNISVLNNYFKNNNSAKEFAIEIFHKGYSEEYYIINNIFDNNGTAGGIGVSVSLNNSLVIGNKFVNTSAENSGTRSGLEFTCANTSIIGNEINNGGISISASDHARFDATKVANIICAENKIFKTAGAGAMIVIKGGGNTLDSIQNLIIYKNSIDFSGTTAASIKGIMFGEGKVSVKNISIEWNTVIGNPARIINTGIFIDSLLYSGDNVSIKNNNIQNCYWGIKDSNTPNSKSSRFSVSNNSLRNCKIPLILNKPVTTEFKNTSN